MALNFVENSYKEKIQLILKLIDCYIKDNKITSDEIYYLLDMMLYFDISKDKNFEGTQILEDIKNIVNIEFAFYTNNKKDLDEDPNLFGEERMKELLLELKEKLKNTI